MIALPKDNYEIVGSIVLYKTPLDEINRAIEQFLAVQGDTHLCVIDNSPAPCIFLNLDCARVTYYHTAANLGYGSAHNLAIRAAAGRAKYSLVMNTDISYAPSVVHRLKDFLDSDPSAGLAAPQIRFPDGTLQYVCRLLPSPMNLFLRRFFPTSNWTRNADHEYELRWWDHSSPANLPYFQGSFLMLRTTLCNELGGFDERFFMYGEDIDLTRRIHKLVRTMYIPDVQVLHEYRRYSSNTWRGTWLGVQNNCRYFNKWGWIFDKERNDINRRTIESMRAVK